MSDPRTPYLDLYKPIVNDEAGEDLWGEKLNSNFDKLDFWAMNQGSIPDVPVDGVLYGRKDRQWSPAASQQEVDDLSDAVDLNTADINTIEADQITQNTEISTKAPLGPSDGAIYGWKGTSWYQVSGSGGMTVTWDQITGKPPTYPPTLPIPESGVTGLPQKQADQDAAIAAINWNSLSGKPATYPPTLPIPSSGVTGLDTKQASQDTAILAREPAIAAGNAAYVWHGDKTWKPESPFPEAPTDGQLYSRKGSTASWVIASAGAVVSDTPPVGMPISTIWWNSSSGGLFIDYQDPNTRQWVMVNAAGMPEANKDGKPYARKDGAWFDLTATLAAYIDQGELNTALAGYLPLTGGTLTGQLAIAAAGVATNSVISVVYASSTRVYMSAGYGLYSAPAEASANGLLAYATGSGAGAIGYMPGATYYGCLSYAGYGLYTNHQAYASLGYIGDKVNVVNQVASSAGFGTFAASGSNTTSNGPSCWIGSNGSLYRSTASSRAVKRDIEPMQEEIADKVLTLPTYWHRYAIQIREPEHFSIYSLMAEEAAAADPRFANWDRAVIYDEEGKPILKYRDEEHPDPEDMMKRITIQVPDGFMLAEEESPQHVNYQAITVALLNVVQRLEARVAALEAASGV